MPPNEIEYLPQFTPTEACRAGKSGWLQPELRIPLSFRDMHMRRLVTFEAEEKTTASLTEQCRPLRRLYRLDSARSARTPDAGRIGVKLKDLLGIMIPRAALTADPGARLAESLERRGIADERIARRIGYHSPKMMLRPPGSFAEVRTMLENMAGRLRIGIVSNGMPATRNVELQRLRLRGAPGAAGLGIRGVWINPQGMPAGERLLARRDELSDRTALPSLVRDGLRGPVGVGR